MVNIKNEVLSDLIPTSRAINTIYDSRFTLILRPHHPAGQAGHQRSRRKALTLCHQIIHPARDDVTLAVGQPAERYVYYRCRSLRNACGRFVSTSGFKEVCLSNTGTEGHHLDSVCPVFFPERL